MRARSKMFFFESQTLYFFAAPRDPMTSTSTNTRRTRGGVLKYASIDLLSRYRVIFSFLSFVYIRFVYLHNLSLRIHKSKVNTSQLLSKVET